MIAGFISLAAMVLVVWLAYKLADLLAMREVTTRGRANLVGVFFAIGLLALIGIANGSLTLGDADCFTDWDGRSNPVVCE